MQHAEVVSRNPANSRYRSPLVYVGGKHTTGLPVTLVRAILLSEVGRQMCNGTTISARVAITLHSSCASFLRAPKDGGGVMAHSWTGYHTGTFVCYTYRSRQEPTVYAWCSCVAGGDYFFQLPVAMCCLPRGFHTRHHGARALSQGLKASCRRLSLVSGNACKTSQGESVTACSLASPQVISVRMLCAVCHGRARGARLMVTHYRMC